MLTPRPSIGCLRAMRMPEITFKGSRYSVEGDLPDIGDSAPDFFLVSTDLTDVSLSHWLKRRKILNVVPSIELPSSRTAVQKFFEMAGSGDDVTLFLVSMDSPLTLKRIIDEDGLPGVVGLSGIRSAGFDKNYGVGIRTGPLKAFYARAVVVIDENDTIVHTELLADVEDEPDYRAACRALGIATEI